MKTLISKLVILVLVGSLSISNVYAQEKQKQDESKKKKEKEIQKKELDSIAEQSKAEYEFELQRLLEEQSEAMEEQSKAFQELEKLSEMRGIEVLPHRDFFTGKDFNITIPDVPTPQIYMFDGDFSAGLMYSFASTETSMASNDGIKFNIGGAAYHINTPKLNFSAADVEELFAKYVVHMRGQFGIFGSNTGLV
ncbi:MAG TPA: hypothetical protein PKM28_04775, partial [Tenuifilaceae bacterium]|nr:hypothetical protein [Tenuifilaceae bacterium]